jgi:dTDP-4-dehydrorhamnose reductase
MRPKLLIFGGGGFVGGNLANVAHRNGWDVAIGDSISVSSADFTELSIVDITNPHEVESLIGRVNPDAVVNLAAVADIDKAEANHEVAWKVNTEGASIIARGCKVHHCKFIHFSSDAIFDGEGESYAENDIAHPVNYYGVTKAEAEKRIAAECSDFVILRISLVLGFPVYSGNSFFAGLKKKLEAGMEILCSVNEIRTPVDALTLSECVLEFAQGNLSGVFHIGSTGSINRYELTRKAAVLMGFSEDLVKIQAVETAGKAPRHKNGIISVQKTQGVLKTKLWTVDESIQRAVFNTPCSQN